MDAPDLPVYNQRANLPLPPPPWPPVGGRVHGAPSSVSAKQVAWGYPKSFDPGTLLRYNARQYYLRPGSRPCISELGGEGRMRNPAVMHRIIIKINRK